MRAFLFSGTGNCNTLPGVSGSKSCVDSANATEAVELVILAGGLSTRMGREKSRLRLGRRTLLGHARANAKATGWPVRIIRRDLVEKCGPLGGIYTALKTSKAYVLVFLACDMPYVSPELIGKIVTALGTRHAGVFSEFGGRPGFPFALRREVLPRISQRIQQQQWALQSLARAAGMRTVRLTKAESSQVFNVNTRDDLETARQLQKSSAGQS